MAFKIRKNRLKLASTLKGKIRVAWPSAGPVRARVEHGRFRPGDQDRTADEVTVGPEQG